MNKPLRIGLAVLLVALAMVAVLMGSLKTPKPKVTFTFEKCTTLKADRFRAFSFKIDNQTDKELSFSPLVQEKPNEAWVDLDPLCECVNILEPGKSRGLGRFTDTNVTSLKARLIWTLKPLKPKYRWQTQVDSFCWKYIQFAPFGSVIPYYTNEIEAVAQSK